MVDCEVQIHASIYGGTDNGAIFKYDIENNGTYSMLYDVKATGTVWSIAVNKQLTEMKTTGGYVYRGKPNAYWNYTPVLNQGCNLDAYGSRKDGMFINASGSNGGNIWYHPDLPIGEPYSSKFTNLPGNSLIFCSGYDLCILDIAFDGNGYAWVIGSLGDQYISTLKQDLVIGGPMKYIGKIKYPGGNSWGIAFDALLVTFTTVAAVDQAHGFAEQRCLPHWVLRRTLAILLELLVIWRLVHIQKSTLVIYSCRWRSIRTD